MAEIKEPKKVIVLGMDGGHPELVQKFVKEGKLPNFERMFKEGVFKEALEPFPTITPPNWTTITTGAWPGTHQITDFFLPHDTGEPLNREKFAFNTQESQAEYIWQAAERAGKKSILIKWEVSWPPVHSGIQIEGCGPGVVNLHELAPVRLHTLEPMPMTNRVTLKKAEGWKGLPESAEALEGKISIFLHGGAEKVYDMAVVKSDHSGYDRLLVCKDKDASQPVAQMGAGHWSDWVIDSFDLRPDEEKLKQREAERKQIKSYAMKEWHDNQVVTTTQARNEGLGLNKFADVTRGSFRFKLINLASDASQMELLSTQIWPTSGYTQPVELGEELLENVGPFFTNPARDALHYQWIDERTFYELSDYQHQWLGKAAKYLAANKPWDLLYVETHCTDYLSHFYLNSYQPECGAPLAEQRNAASWLTRHYQSIDRMLGDLLAIADDETLLVVVSDHSGTGCPQPKLDTRKVLEQAGLTVYKTTEEGRRVVDWTQTKAVQACTIFAYVNLKGRDPEGIVEPQDYDKVVDETITAMLDYTDPVTGLHPYALVLRKEDAALLGLWGERVGDIVFALRPEFDLEHGGQLPTARIGDLTIRSLLFMRGPNIKQGVKLQNLTQIVAVTPTICHMLGLPMPKQSEGPILWEAMEDPDFRLNQFNAMKAELEQLRQLQKQV
ncbi:MAG: alkaline phosphatase family protein [Chloroflexota bacterium]